MKILVVAAHPDDEVLGCAATLATLSSAHDVRVAILGEGASSRHTKRQDADRKALRRLQEHAKAAAKLVGARLVSLGGLPDNRFDELPLLDITKLVERWIVTQKPQAIYTHSGGDLNIDHQRTFRAVLTATRPMQGGSVKELYSFEVPSSTEWAFQRCEPVFRPNVFVDVSSTIDVKIRAMQIYADEIRSFPHPRSPEALRVIARRWGSVVGVEYAEAFELIRAIR
jgi:LmbE family N-acetylglucosaminyl deacetylase